jgi:hypothetical protein
VAADLLGTRTRREILRPKHSSSLMSIHLELPGGIPQSIVPPALRSGRSRGCRGHRQKLPILGGSSLSARGGDEARRRLRWLSRSSAQKLDLLREGKLTDEQPAAKSSPQNEIKHPTMTLTSNRGQESGWGEQAAACPKIKERAYRALISTSKPLIMLGHLSLLVRKVQTSSKKHRLLPALLRV